jgi:uncharacterized membrane protein
MIAYWIVTLWTLFVLMYVTYVAIVVRRDSKERRRIQRELDLLGERIGNHNSMPKPVYDLQGRRIS